MAIRNRQGDYNNFEPNKMVSGEFAYVNSSDPNTADGKGVYATFTGGKVKRLCTYEEVSGLVAQADEIKTDVSNLKDDVIALKDDTEDIKDATADIRDNAEEYAELSKSYAVGTNDVARAGDSEDNAKYYKEWIENAVERNIPQFSMDFDTGHLNYFGGAFMFTINSNGHMLWQLS